MNRFSLLLAASSIALLTACSGDDVRSTIGLERTAPDEFRVVSRPPLSVPPEFTLRPPLPGEDEVAHLPSDKLTRSMLTGTTAEFDTNTLPTKADGTPLVDTAVMPVESGNAPSGAESELLTRLGADQKESGIRDKIAEDQVIKAKEKEEDWFQVDALNPFAEDKDSLDATEEVRKLKDEGKPVIGKHLVLDEEPKKEEPVAEAPKAEEKKEEPAPVVEAPKVEEKKEEPKAEEKPKEEAPAEKPSTTLKDVLDKKAAEKAGDTIPVTILDKEDSVINLEAPENAAAPEPAKEEPVKAEEKIDSKRAEAPKEEKKPDEKPAENKAPLPERKMPSKIIVK